jgi:hypothetical protein
VAGSARNTSSSLGKARMPAAAGRPALCAQTATAIPVAMALACQPALNLNSTRPDGDIELVAALRRSDPVCPMAGSWSRIKDAIDHLSKTVPKAERDHPKVLTAATCLTTAAEGRDLVMHARIATLQALNRHVERVFNPDRKDHHWGKRKLKRDE